jgi:hypothetical protein
VIDQDYDEGYHDDMPVRKRPSSTFIIGFGLLALSVVGFTFAANLTIGKGNKLEFGQGLYQITSCDQWIGFKLNPTAATYGSGGGQSRVANMNLSGFDALSCRGKDIKIQLLDGSSAILPIFSDASGLVDRVLLNVSSSAVKRANAVGFYNGFGVLVTSSLSGSNGYAYDSGQYLSYNSTTGVYTILFNSPQATMSAVNSLTVQSASAS